MGAGALGMAPTLRPPRQVDRCLAGQSPYNRGNPEVEHLLAAWAPGKSDVSGKGAWAGTPYGNQRRSRRLRVRERYIPFPYGAPDELSGEFASSGESNNLLRRVSPIGMRFPGDGSGLPHSGPRFRRSCAMTDCFTSEQRYWWRIALELKLRKCSGDAFQDFFSTVMGQLHRDDFVRVRAFGQIGDKGCDGYLKSSGQVFACYGALNGDFGKVAYLIDKMEDDYQKAVAAIPAIMKEWHMVHNLVDGLPTPAIEKLDALASADGKRKFGFIGLDGFQERIFSLKADQIEDLLGVVASSADSQNLQVAELRDLMAHVIVAGEQVQFDVTAIKPVPAGKLDFNNLPSHWRFLIAGGWQNAHHVESYLNRHVDPLTGEKIAQIFRTRYAYLKAQHLEPGSIMSALST